MIISALCMLLFESMQVYAADASVTFGSGEYEAQNGEEFPVGAYIRSESGVGRYQVTIRYNPLVLEYLDGADGVDAEQGIITLSGEGGESELRYMLRFRAISDGEASIQFETAELYVPDTADERYEITAYGNAPVNVVAVDEAAAEAARLAEEARQAEEARLAEEARQAAEAERLAAEVRQVTEALLTEAEQLAEKAHLAEEARQAAEAERLAEEARRAEEARLAEEQLRQQEKRAAEAAKPSGEADSGRGRNASIFYNVYVAIVLTIVVLAIVIVVILQIVKRVTSYIKRRSEDEVEEEQVVIVSDEATDTELLDADAIDETNRVRKEELQRIKSGEKPVIRIKDVTMEFHLASNNPSGLKDYIIQLLKRQITYRKLFALYHVSFDVFKGEVVGIIGTNGSGKSTLLKIVSGALKPTDGKVIVNRRKVQLLTLGTGFDMELSARENVYLNGSIIGYSKEFLDEHYDDIVAFAELEDFMEEQVKNFSSGMVSRLGFAIATAGDAAEILILDEVLSVGDEFFRKKSLKRIKEMIHGGSTVLMVSHGMGTILENCTKVVWIEKGVLKMVGEAKKVCGAYQRGQ